MSELTASAERALFETNRPAWLAYVAPRMATRLRAMTDVPDVTLSDAWGFLQRDYQRAVWVLLDEPTRTRIRNARRAATMGAAA